MTTRPNRFIVCFDLGGVLLELCQSWEQAWRRAGIEGPMPQARLHTQAYVQRASLQQYHAGRMSLSDFAHDLAHDLGVKANDVEAMYQSWVVGEFPDSARLIAELLDRDVPVALLSNTCDLHWQQVHAWPALAAVPNAHIFLSYKLGHAKPAGAAFGAVEEGMNRAAGEIVFFDDTLANVAAAQARGWLSTRIDPQAQPTTQIRRRLQELSLLPS